MNSCHPIELTSRADPLCRPIDWAFPSPNATPTHSAFGHDVFQTPKTTATNHPSHFQDAFATPQMTVYGTPRLQQSTPNQYATAPQQYLQPVQLSFASPQAQWANSQPAHMPHNGSHSTQTQTPPPTRDSVKMQVQQQVAFGTPSTIASRRYMTPQHGMSGVEDQELHLHMPMGQPLMNGPATAPVKSTFVWDMHPSPIQARQSTLVDPFMSNIPDGTAWAFQERDREPTLQEQISQTVQQSIAMSSAENASMLSLSGSVDPSLVYSSPVAPPQSRLRPSMLVPDRRRVSANKHNRTDTTSSNESASLRPSVMLRRSNTTGSARPSASSDALGRVDAVPPRTASPLKRAGRSRLDSITESFKLRQRSSVILTVDENGIARTETSEEAPMRSMRARYPALFDSDSSDNESEGSFDSSSRRTSFTFSKREERKQKAPKLDPPIEKFEGLTIPRSSSSASMRGTVTPSRAAVAAAAQLRKQGSFRRTNSLRQSRMPAPIDTYPMGGHDETNDVSPDKQLPTDMLGISNKRLRPPHAMQNTIDAHNRRWSLMSGEQTQDPFASSVQRRPLRKIRCVCGLTSEELPVVQCVSCTQWSHTVCVGHASAAGFTCVLCTKPL